MMINHRQHDGKGEENDFRMKGSMNNDNGTTKFDDESM